MNVQKQIEGAWHNTYQQAAFANFENFKNFLGAVNAKFRGLQSSSVRFIQSSPIIIGEGRNGLPETIMFVPPRPQDVPARLEDLRIATVSLKNPAERAALMNLGLQLIHPMDDGNKRLGDYAHQVLLGEKSADPRFMDSDIRAVQAEMLRRGGIEQPRVTKRGPALILLGRFGQFSAVFGTKVPFEYMGILAPGFDELTMPVKEQVVRSSLAHIKADKSLDFEALVLQVIASQTGFNPFKIAMLNLLSKNAIIEPSAFVRTTPFDQAAKQIDILQMPQLLRQLNSAYAQKLLDVCWQLTNIQYEFLNLSFTHPEHMPAFSRGAGLPPITLKDLLMNVS